MSSSFSEDTRPIQPVTSDSAPVTGAPPRRRRKKRGPKWVRQTRKALSGLRFFTALVVLIGLSAVVVVGTLVVAADAQTKIQASYSNLNRVLNTVSATPGNELTFAEFTRLQTAVNELANTLTATRSQISFIRSLAQVNPELEAAVISLDAGDELARAAQEILNGIQPTLFFLVAGRDDEAVVTSVSSGERIVELLELGSGQFVSAQQRLIAARAIIDAIELESLSASTLLGVERLRGFANQLEQINNIMLQLPDLLETAFGLGVNGDSSYLVLSQNNDELRPSGGFISTFGWLVVRNGRVLEYDYSPSGSGEPNPPPPQFADQINPPSWWLRYREPIYMAWDGSWYADFPETARMASWFYNSGSNPRSPVDGVIAIDIDGFLYLLNALGDVEVPSYGVVVNAGNFRQVVYDIRAYSPGLEPHKEFVAAVYSAVFDRWQQVGIDPETTSRVFGALLRALQEKHVMLYFADERLNEAVDLLGWSGQQSAGIGYDYLMVNDANLGNKSNSSILRQTIYDVDLQPDGSARTRATVLYNYPARLAASDPAVNPEFHGQVDYFNLLQVFTPVNSQLISASENTLRPTTTHHTPEHAVFVSLLTVPYDFSERYQLNYTTTGTVERFGAYWRYRLLVQKQPGTRAEAVNVQITLPVGASLIEVTPLPAAQYTLERQLVEFQLELTTDRWIEVIYAL